MQYKQYQNTCQGVSAYCDSILKSDLSADKKAVLLVEYIGKIPFLEMFKKTYTPGLFRFVGTGYFGAKKHYTVTNILEHAREEPYSATAKAVSVIINGYACRPTRPG